ncbi:RecBCD enzyme subunit RecD [Shewanella sp. NFH-SH190041]|uniref:exodeoxyribonuclease V subunit alpha n=1 Tax=Shewanella sp. NFH-SH190041 TaxID=2950245 RepID=UPI0021C2622F|nr:exodeoxyribonuclease V subunit alpha [Shewanella sp. NFH-SH190041]BDM64054.1 RecBCD enzyme subunit RecD [Shewanella sp. NFH-SH190041]
MIETTQPIGQLLQQWEQERLLTPLDRHFALQMAAIHRDDSPLFILICALLSRQLSAQHACLPLAQLNLANPMLERSSQIQINAPLTTLLNAIAALPAVGDGKDNTPMVLDGSRLYLKQYYDFELRVAKRLKQMAAQILPVPAGTAAALAQLFPPMADSKDTDWQKVATATAICQRFAVITGGPGTGKTTTVTKLLMLLCLNKEMTIRLVAPTGKAAARLTESIKASKRRLLEQLSKASPDKAEASDLNAEVIARIPEDAATLHRLLGVIPGSHKFRHHKDNPLHLDLLIVDEASMVDLPMMDRLLDALPPHARLILLGDQDQLASVEAGAVLADICAGLRSGDNWQMRYSADFATQLSQLCHTDMAGLISSNPGIGNNLCMLRHSHRFATDAGIGILANAVNRSDKADIQQTWQQGHHELTWLDHGNGDKSRGLTPLLTQACEYYRHYLEVIHRPDFTAEQIIDRYNAFRILCATRAGEFGVDGINAHMTAALKQAGFIQPGQEFYPGRPIIIHSNDYNLGLFNGDIGIILPCNDSQRLMAHFIQADGSVLKVLPARLPGHETCFAMTVHKSQGSEFATVALVLPPRPSPAQRQLLTKELIYTAITRAKTHFICLGSQKVFEAACLHPTVRASGLAQRLWSQNE